MLNQMYKDQGIVKVNPLTFDVWVVCPTHLATKENRKDNKSIIYPILGKTIRRRKRK
jgi:hypothetical protein